MYVEQGSSFLKQLKITTIFIILTVVSGCALVDPYINIDKNVPILDTNTSEVCGLDARPGVRRACSYRTEYLKRLGADATYRNVIGLTLIPISATALGLGIESSSPSAITILGLTGSSMYASGQLLTSRPREAVLLQGLSAISCAMTASYSVTIDEFSERTLNSGVIDQLVIDSGILHGENIVLRTKIAMLSEGSKKAALIRFADQVDELAQSANSVAERATRMRSWIHERDTRLGLASDDINAKVNQSLQNTIVDLQGIMAIVQNILPNASLLAPPPTIETPELDNSEDAIDVATLQSRSLSNECNEECKIAELELLNVENALVFIEQMTKSLSAVSGQSQQLRNVISMFSGVQLPSQIQGCDLNLPDPIFNLTLLPNGPITVQGGTDWTGAFAIEGGSGPFEARVIGGKGITVVSTQRSIQVSVPSETVAGSYNIYVRDKVGQSAQVKITVKANSVADETPGEDETADPDITSPFSLPREHLAKDITDGLQLCPTPPNELVLYGDEQSLLAEESKRKTLQKALGFLGVNVDGELGQKTRVAICEWQTQQVGGDASDAAVTGYLNASQIISLLETVNTDE